MEMMIKMSCKESRMNKRSPASQTSKLMLFLLMNYLLQVIHCEDSDTMKNDTDSSKIEQQHHRSKQTGESLTHVHYHHKDSWHPKPHHDSHGHAHQHGSHHGSHHASPHSHHYPSPHAHYGGHHAAHHDYGHHGRHHTPHHHGSNFHTHVSHHHPSHSPQNYSSTETSSVTTPVVTSLISPSLLSYFNHYGLLLQPLSYTVPVIPVTADYGLRRNHYADESSNKTPFSYYGYQIVAPNYVSWMYRQN